MGVQPRLHHCSSSSLLALNHLNRINLTKMSETEVKTDAPTAEEIKGTKRTAEDELDVAKKQKTENGSNGAGNGAAAEENGADVEEEEDVVSGALTSITDADLKGTYYKLGEMTDEQRDFLLGKGYLFQIPTARNLLMGAGAARDWPDNRGIFHNDNQTALAWCNEEDHCRIISMKNGGDIPDVFARFCNLSKALEATGASLMRNDKLGYMGTCPSNLGTGLRASVMVKLVKFNELLENPNSSHEDKELLKQVCAQFDLQPRGSAGEHSPAVGAKFDVSNKQRLGFSEVQLVQKMIDGVTKLITLEEKLAGGATPAQVRAEAGISS